MKNRRLFNAILKRVPMLAPAFVLVPAPARVPGSGPTPSPSDRRQGWHAMSGSSGGEPKRTIRAGRRRPSGPSEPSERETAQAPQRERPSAEERPAGTGYTAGSGGTYQQPSSTSGGQLPQLPIGKLSPKMLMVIAGIAVVACICIALFMFMQGPMKMPFLDYMADIGLTYLIIPSITIGFAFTQSRLRRI